MEHNDNLMMLTDDTGVYTDTAEFTEFIPECTNISVGYDREHTQSESLNLVHYQQLSSAAAQIDWDSLPTSRDPSVAESLYDNYSTHGQAGWWTQYTMPTTSYSTTKYHYPDPRREEAIDAVIDAQYGYHLPLSDMIAASVWPEDKQLALRHMNFKQLDPAMLDEAFEMLDAGEDIDLVLGMLFDEMHVH